MKNNAATTFELVEDTSKDRAIVNFLNSKAWAITPEALSTIQEIVVNHMDGVEVKLASDSTAKSIGHIGYPNVAVIPIHGTVAKKLYGLDAISGGTTTQTWQAQIQDALNDNSITSIVLDVDSPGGTVDGTKELADFIAKAKEEKPIVAYANGQMCSAAYWIGSAASKIVAFDTAQVGSIGVIISHKDFSAREKMMGVKTTHIYAGKYKALGSPYEPLSETSEKYLQDSVDYYYTMFVDAVAGQRGVDTKTVLEKMAEGRVFIGAQSREVGLVDLIGNLEDAIKLSAQGGNKVTIQEAVKEFGATNLLAHLVTANAAELPQQVVEAYSQASTPVMEIPAEFRELIEGLQTQVQALTEDKTVAEAALEAEREKVALEQKEARVKDTLAELNIEATDGLFKVGMDLDPEDFQVITDRIASLQAKITEVSGELFVETENATSESPDTEVPKDFDAACVMVAKRDKIDIEEAINVAAKEFPVLASSYNEGGTE